eukprot:71941_1
MYKIVSSKRAKPVEMNISNAKYHQLFESKSNVNESKQDNNATHDQSQQNEYNFGFEFEYGYAGEILSGYTFHESNRKSIKQYYCTFKEEILSDAYFNSPLNIQQFNHEYNKDLY